MSKVARGRAFSHALQRELALVEQAIRFVAAGHAPRVVVANLRYGRVALEAARPFAEASGVDLATIAAADGARVDLVAGWPA